MLRRRHQRRLRCAVLALAAVLAVLFALALCIGHASYSPATVVAALRGDGAGPVVFTVRTLRLPRAITAVAVGGAFGMAGATFQTLLRNVLASPDVIGVTAGASTAAVACITVFAVGGLTRSLVACAGGLAVALVIVALAGRGPRQGTQLVVIGLAAGALLTAITSYLLMRANSWDVPEAMRWLTGSLNASFWVGVPPLLVGVGVAAPINLYAARRLRLLELGDDVACALGVPVGRIRLVLIASAVVLASVATASSGPIAFVALLAGPLAVAVAGTRDGIVVTAGLVGAALVLAADLLAQFALPTVYPVGVVTGAIGAPYLMWTLLRSRRLR